MSNTTNSMASLLEDVNRLNENGLEIMRALYDAITSNKTNSSAIIELANGEKKNIIIPSNIFLKSELDRLKLNIQNITGGLNTKSGGVVSIIDDNNNTIFRKIFLSTFEKVIERIKIDEIDISTNIIINKNPLIDKLLSPLTTLEYNIPNRFNKSKNIIITKVFIDKVGDIINGFTYSETIQYLIDKKISYNISNDIVKLNPNKVRFFGEFSVLQIENNDDDTFTCRFDKKTYSDIKNVTEGSRELEAGDKLITHDGNGIYIIKKIVDSGLGVFVTLTNVVGFTGIDVGISKMKFYDDNNSNKTVSIPIKGEDKFILFFSSLDDISDTQGVHSDAIVVDTKDIKITQNGIQTDFNTYFDRNILSLGNYLESVVSENSVPRSLATLIKKPKLSVDYFKVTQVNKHITNTADSKKLKNFSAEKSRLNSEIAKLSSAVKKLSERINKGQYKSRDEKGVDESRLSELIKQKRDKQTAYNSTVDNIKNLSSFLNAPKASPKYRILGFWDIAEPISDITGKTQRIVQYEVRYKYVPTNTDVSETTSIDIGGKEGLIPAWNDIKTLPLTKKYNTETQKYTWESVNISDGDVNNINQVEVPISYGESVVIQLRAVGEAGYPTNPILSEWSDTIKIDFPEEYAQDETVRAIVQSNEDDLVKVEVDRAFETSGLTRHIRNSYTEQDRTFDHHASGIASGFYTKEQKTISVNEKFKDMELKITKLQDIVDRRNTAYSVEVLGQNGRVYPVNKLSTIELFAGHYMDDVNINKPEEYGTIIEKVFYLRLINNNPSNADIPSLSSGLLTSNTSDNKYSDVSFGLVGNSTPQKQRNGQIIYLRSKDLSGGGDLVYHNDNQTMNEIDVTDTKITAMSSEHNAVGFDGSSFTSVKLLDSARGVDYIALAKTHPYYQDYMLNTTNPLKVDALTNEFKRVRDFNSSLLEINKQQNVDSNKITQFTDNDKYLIGKNSTGSKLFMRISDVQNIQVKTSDTSSSISLKNGHENALLIPIVFQYRMLDAIGRINGDSNLSLTASNVDYKKKLGIDLIVGNELFKFDIVVSSKFKQTTLTASNSSNNRIIDSIDPQKSSTARIL